MPHAATVLALLTSGFALLGGLLQQASAAPAPRYEATRVGQANQYVLALSLNDNGQVVGLLDGGPTSSTTEAFMWDGQAGLRGLGTLGGASSVGYGINNSGQIVGYSELASGRTQAFIYERGAMRALETPGAVNSVAMGINASGQVTGRVDLVASTQWFIHDGSAMQLIEGIDCCGPGSPAVRYYSAAINDHGDIAGMMERPIPSRFVYEGIVYRNHRVFSLGTLSGGTQSWASDINNSGQVVGGSESDGEINLTSGFLWTEETGMIDLATFEGGAYVANAHAINDLGAVVGELGGHGGGAFLLSEGKIVNLQELLEPDMAAQWRLVNARDINNRGQILVSAHDPALREWGNFLLTPVPESKTVALMTAGLGLLAFRLRRRSH